MPDAALIGRFGAARVDPASVVLEGLHALKHALRFGASIEIACASQPAAVLDLARRLTPDLVERLAALLQVVPPAVFAALAPVPPPTGVIALAKRPQVDVGSVLGGARGAPLVLLENPSHLGNLGAVVRTAAAAEAGAVLVTGRCDPWHPAALRGSAGLHFALPVAHLDALPDGRPLLAIDPEGEPLSADLLRGGPILAFGSERRGLGEALLARAERRIAIPMRAGVSSLNLAGAVAVVLYAWRLAGD